MLRAIDRMTPGDMPDFDPSLQMALRGLRNVPDAMTQAHHRHQRRRPDPADPAAGQPARHQQGHRDDRADRRARQRPQRPPDHARTWRRRPRGGSTTSPTPRPCRASIRRRRGLISRPLIFEQPNPWAPRLNTPSEPVTGLPADLPPISGLVLTSVKENELVEIPLTSPLPTGQVNPAPGPLDLRPGPVGRLHLRRRPALDHALARLGELRRVLVAGHPLVDAARRPRQPDADRPPRPGPDQGGGRRARQGEPVPELPPGPGERRQPRPEAVDDRAGADGARAVRGDGRRGRGQRQLLHQPRLSRARRRAGGDLLGGLRPLFRRVPRAAVEPRHAGDRRRVDRRAGLDLEVPARRPARPAADARRRRPLPPRREPDAARAASPPLWPDLLWLAAVLFLADVAVRRVAPDFDRIRRSTADAWTAAPRGARSRAPSEYMEKLKSRKAEVGEQLDRTRSATRFEAPPAVGPIPRRRAAMPTVAEATAEAERRPDAPPGGPSLAPETPPEAEPESYTDRLLRAKQKVWEERDKDKVQVVTSRGCGPPFLRSGLDGRAPDPPLHRDKGQSPMATAEPQRWRPAPTSSARPTAGSRPRSAR